MSSQTFSAGRSSRSGGRPGRWFRLPRKWWTPYLFLLPNMAIFGTFTIYPALNSFNISFYNSSNGRTFTPVGINNYHRLLSNAEFWGVFRQTMVFVVAFVVLSVVLSTLLSVLLEAQRRGRTFFRAVFFIPTLLSPVVIGLVWGWILQRRGGLLNYALGLIHGPQPGWLEDPSLALVSVVAVGIWIHLGFYILITLAGMQSIDPMLYEASSIDGATAFQTMWTITIPMLRPTTLVVLILSTIGGLEAFDYLYTLTGGGPAGATTLMVQYIYEKAFTSPVQYGLASAGGVILFVIVMLFTLVNFLVGRKQDAL